MNDKLLGQEKIINDYKNKISGLDKKIIEIKNIQNDYKTLNARIPLGIEEQNNNIDGIFHERQNNINKNINDMRRYNSNMILNNNRHLKMKRLK